MKVSLSEYGITKLFNTINGNILHKKYHDKGVCINSLHPGVIDT
jgi:hypothetical protein